MWLSAPAAAHGQFDVCAGLSGTSGLIWGEEPATATPLAPKNVIVIGFVGGFVKAGDLKHPEVRFSACLRERYPSIVHTAVFANRDHAKALRQILHWLAADGTANPTAAEKRDAAIIIYGHSWGASQTVELARDLWRLDIPVLLTIQVDSVRKAGHRDSIIPPNVKNAINFYQTRGLIRGRRLIRAADPERTTILGNFQMSYEGRQVNSGHCSWFARTFSGDHCKIENDVQVWGHIASLVESKMAEAINTERFARMRPLPQALAGVPPHFPGEERH